MEHKQRGTSCVYTARREWATLYEWCFMNRLNFENFWTKIWPCKQLKAMNDILDRQFSTYSRARRSVLLQTSFSFWEIARCPVNCTHLTTFRLWKITTANDIRKKAPSGPAFSIVQYIGNQVSSDPYIWFQKKILDCTNHVSSKSMESRPCTCAVERYRQTVSCDLNSRALCYINAGLPELLYRTDVWCPPLWKFCTSVLQTR